MLALASIALAPALQAANFTTTVSEGSGNNWNLNNNVGIWQPGNATPTAGNTYECLGNGVGFGATATGGAVANTRIRNPATAGVQTFAGDSLKLNADTEIRAKQVGAILNFPGVGGNPGLILNGGALNAGDDTVFQITGSMEVTATSYIVPADNGAGNITPLRGFNIAGKLAGTSPIVIAQAGQQVAQEVSSSYNPFSGGWVVKCGWLKGSGRESLGSGNILIDPNYALAFSGGSTLSNGPARLELMYDIISPGTLTLANGGKLVLHQHCRFSGVTIEGTPLAEGKHTYAELLATFPNNIVAAGSGSITVGAAPRIVTVNTTNNDTPGAGETSLAQAISGLQAGDVVRFNIPGAGPHVLKTPLGGYALITVDNVTIDGYSQPGSAANSNPILNGNNAQIKIVLDSTDADGAENPSAPALTLRRSTRLPYDGYGDSENGILGVLGADGFTVRGLSFIGRVTHNSDSDPKIYCVALVQEATNAVVQGCWFGLGPTGTGQADVRGCGSAVAAFRYRPDGGPFYSQGLIFGTDGDGVHDAAEFNIVLGMNIGLALELPNTKISGNYFNVFPDGKTFLDIDAYYALQLEGSDGDSDTLENMENGRVADNTIIGTDGDGVSDENERNIFNHAVYDHEIEVYSKGTNIVLAGNYFGVGVDGSTLAPLTTNSAPDLIELPGTSSIRVGAKNGASTSAVEGNVIVRGPGTGFVVAGSSVPITARGNSMRLNNYLAVPFADGQNGRNYASYYAPYVVDSSAAVPRLIYITNGVLVGSFGLPSGVDYTTAYLDLYTVDGTALASTNNWPLPITHSAQWLKTFQDNDASDLDPAPGAFAVALTSFNLPATTYVAVAATYAKADGPTLGGESVTTPLSNPITPRPILHISVTGDTAEVSWLSSDIFRLEVSTDLTPNGWVELPPATYTGGRNITSLQFFPNTEEVGFFRTRSTLP